MENRLLNRERMERMIEARDAAEAAKLLAECGYEDGGALTPQRLEELLAQSRSAAFRESCSRRSTPARTRNACWPPAAAGTPERFRRASSAARSRAAPSPSGRR